MNAIIHGNTVAFDLDGITDAVADLNGQRHRHGCTCRARASFAVLATGWVVCGTTHDHGCPAVAEPGGGR